MGSPSVFGGRVARTENLLEQLVAGLPVGISAVLLAFGVDARITAITGLFLFLWPLFVKYEGPPVSEDPEYSYLRSLRVKLYMVGLIIAIPLNGIAFFYSFLLAPIVVVVVAALLSTAFGMMLQGPLRTLEPRPAEREDFKEMVFKVGGAAIFLSTGLLWVDILALAWSYASGALLIEAVVLILLAYLNGRMALDREFSSRTYARSLADSLRKRNWWRQFESRTKRKRLRRGVSILP